MRKTLSFVLVVLAMPVLAAQTAQQPTGTSGDIDSAIKAVADQYVKATLAGDAKTIASLYTEDAVEMPPNEPMIKGRAAIEQHYEKLFKMGKISAFTLTHLSTQSSGNIGYDVGTYNQHMMPAGGSERTETGKYTVVLRRSGGEWKVAYAIYNSDSPAMPKK
jgi:uncharacterized protein (TIGR02246 family)